MSAQARCNSDRHDKELLDNENRFSFSLAKALRCVDTPVTVGFYTPLGDCKKRILDKFEEYMSAPSEKKGQQEVRKTNEQLTGLKLVTVIFRMIFYYHVPTSDGKQPKSVQNIFIHFSAWEYAGTDHVWAGLVTTLCDGIEKHCGRIPLSVYRTVGQTYDTASYQDEQWVSKKYLCLPLWAAILLICGVAFGVAVLICIHGVPLGSFPGNIVVLLEVVGAAVAGGAAFPTVKMVFRLMHNVIVTQKVQLEKQMARTDVSAQLGFMGKVKREVKVITSYLQFMETVQCRKFRVVLKITSLERCSPDKVVGVLEAINILHSDCKSPFISILVADLNVIVECVENSKYVKEMGNNGYKFLNRIILLPFSLPKVDYDDKIELIKKMVSSRMTQEKSLKGDKVLEEDFQQKKWAKVLNESGLYRSHKSADQKLSSTSGDDSQVPLVLVGSPKTKKTVNLIQEALAYLLDDNMMTYLTDNKVQMKRTINTIVVMASLMEETFPPDEICPKKVTSWVVLANQWPCRLSWILQCIEDNKQMGGFSSDQKCKVSLWEVYETYMEELDALKDELKKLLELDGDPELFHNFLNRQFEVKDSTSSLEVKERTVFQVKDATLFLPYTVNLDSSLKRRMELLRGSHNLKWTKKTHTLSKRTLLGMTADQVCEELDSLSLKEENAQRYKERLREHHLNGQALLYSNQQEIKDALGMSLGEWVAFRMRFLDSVPAQGLRHSTPPLYVFAEKDESALQKSPPLKEAGCPDPSKLVSNKTSQSWFPSR